MSSKWPLGPTGRRTVEAEGLSSHFQQPLSKRLSRCNVEKKARESSIFFSRQLHRNGDFRTRFRLVSFDDRRAKLEIDHCHVDIRGRLRRYFNVVSEDSGQGQPRPSDLYSVHSAIVASSGCGALLLRRERKICFSALRAAMGCLLQTTLRRTRSGASLPRRLHTSGGHCQSPSRFLRG